MSGIGMDDGFGFDDEVATTNTDKPTLKKAKSLSIGTIDAPEKQVVIVDDPPAREIKEEIVEDSTVFSNKPHFSQSKSDRAVSVMLRKAGVSQPPEISELMKNKVGESIVLSDIGIFSKDCTEDESLNNLKSECNIENTISLSGPLSYTLITNIGVELIKSGRMFTPIHLARIQEDGSIQCISGRHRLASIGLIYGSQVSISAYVEDMSLSEAKQAVIYANDCRSAKALERVESVMVKSSGVPSADLDQKQIYESTITAKSKAKKYCVLSVIKNGYPAGLTFPLSSKNNRSDGGLTTISNLENFWGSAIDWTPDMPQEKFDTNLKSTVDFLNTLVSAMISQSGFDPKHHLSAFTMSAIGLHYKQVNSVLGSVSEETAKRIAYAIVRMGKIGRKASVDTQNELAEILRG